MVYNEDYHKPMLYTNLAIQGAYLAYFLCWLGKPLLFRRSDQHHQTSPGPPRLIPTHSALDLDGGQLLAMTRLASTPP